MRIMEVTHNELECLMNKIQVDPYGIKIMAPKTMNFLVRINALPNFKANILKQEMLSIGADAAVSRACLTGKARRTDCLLMANLAQFRRLQEKLAIQPFGLDALAKELKDTLANYQKDDFTLKLNKFELKLKPFEPKIMAVVNLTPDSFSGDGLYKTGKNINDPGFIYDYVEQKIREGADIIDIGGESNRPQARPVDGNEEIRRTIPAIRFLAKKIKIPISIDTAKPEVARQALTAGASLVNDITGLRNPKMAKIVSREKAGIIIMHMKGNPRTMQNNPYYGCLIEDIIESLRNSILKAESCGIPKNRIIVDPGIGFGKTLHHNLEILKNLKEFKILGLPLMVGTSRKSFIGKILNSEAKDRIHGTVATCILAAENGANILRVHDVKEVRQALKIYKNIRKA